jgi:endo-1,4-beta-xylanase
MHSGPVYKPSLKKLLKQLTAGGTMLQRRQVTCGALQVCAGLALEHGTGLCSKLWAQQSPADEMGANTQAHAESAPSPDFGPVPTALPAETLAVSGSKSLGNVALKHNALAGAAINVDLLSRDSAYRQLLASQVKIAVTEREMKWDVLRPAPDKFSFDAADAFMKFAEQHKIKARGHNFVWHEALPAWFVSTATKENARQLLVDHITTVGQRYRGRIHSWDVVNEAVLPKDGRPDRLRNSPWMKLLGPEYIDIAFRAARDADPRALLTYNEYGVEYDNDEESERRAVMLELLRRLKAANVPIDAVGIQGHIKAASPYSIGDGLRKYMAAIREMGLQIYITELDVNEDDIKENEVEMRDRIVADTYRQFLSVAMGEKAVKAVVTWGITDRYTWLNSGPTHKRKQPNRPQRCLPFDPQYRPTPAFFAMRDAIERRTIKQQVNVFRRTESDVA